MNIGRKVSSYLILIWSIWLPYSISKQLSDITSNEESHAYKSELTAKSNDTAPLDSCYDLLNNKRLLHYNTKPLNRSEKLELDAEKWAKHLIDVGEIKRESSIQHGETIYCDDINRNENNKENFDQICCIAIMEWYNGVLNYNYKHPDKYEQTSSFTQIVWKSTEEIGIGVARNRKSACVVARYKPRGNIPGLKSFQENVQPIK